MLEPELRRELCGKTVSSRPEIPIDETVLVAKRIYALDINRAARTALSFIRNYRMNIFSNLSQTVSVPQAGCWRDGSL